MKRNALLATAFLVPCALYSMDTAESIVPQKIFTQKKAVNNLCLGTCAMLKSFESSDKKGPNLLIKIIEEADCLKSADITGREIGFYLLKQSGNILPRISFNTYSNPLSAAIFLARLDDYNTDLAKQQLVSPNITQLKHHLKNQQISRTAENARTKFGISIPQQTIDERTIPTQGSVAVTLFDALLDHIRAMLKGDAKEIKRTVNLIYHAEINRQLASNDSQTVTQTASK